MQALGLRLGEIDIGLFGFYYESKTKYQQC